MGKHFASRIEDDHESFYFLTSDPTIALHLVLHARTLQVLRKFLSVPRENA